MGMTFMTYHYKLHKKIYMSENYGEIVRMATGGGVGKITNAI